MQNVLFIFFLPLWVVLSSSSAYGSDFQARVIHVTDGDTIMVLNEVNEQVKIRLNGIDCPEKAQAFGNKAKQFTKELVAGQTVTIQAYDLDKYSRTIGDVILEDGRNLSQELVKAGYAWWFFTYSDDERLCILEVQAKIAKVGLWADKNPIPPWIYRKSGGRSSELPIEEKVEEGEQRIQPPVCYVPSPPPGDPYPILGNRKSKKYHRPDCLSYCSMSPKNRVAFPSPQDAEQAGFILAGNCPP